MVKIIISNEEAERYLSYVIGLDFQKNFKAEVNFDFDTMEHKGFILTEITENEKGGQDE